MQQSQATGVSVSLPNKEYAPRLLIQWEPWWPSFLRNLLDFLRYERSRRPASPGPFWKDVLVQRPLPWKNFGESALLHLLVVVLLITFNNILWSKKFVQVRSPYEDTTITYYKVSEYLPQIKPKPRPKDPKPKVKGQPEFAPQQIISVPPTPDNSAQTIINPPHPDILRNETPLPNIVAWTPVAPAPPTAALAKTQTRVPLLQQTVAPPPPDVRRANQIVFPKLPQPVVVQPALTAEDLRKAGDVDIPLLAAKVDAPKIPAAEPATTAKTSQAAAPPPPPPPSTAGLKPGTQAAGALIALNVRPEEPKEAIKVPDGSRHGVFAATPEGRKGAPGTPDDDGPADTAGASGRGAASTGSDDGPETGISIGGGAPSPSTSTPVVQRAANPNPLLAALSKPSLRDLAHAAKPAEPGTKIEDKVFGGKRVYSLKINMPNLTSAGGSWIIHFAEIKKDGKAGDLSTPVPVDKVDPAYPSDLMRARVEGTVIVYAIIHADGTVGETKVLHGFDEKLDQNAVNAVLRWHFRPATRNGQPVELEAVFQVPFRTKKGF